MDSLNLLNEADFWNSEELNQDGIKDIVDNFKSRILNSIGETPQSFSKLIQRIINSLRSETPPPEPEAIDLITKKVKALENNIVETLLQRAYEGEDISSTINDTEKAILEEYYIQLLKEVMVKKNIDLEEADNVQQQINVLEPIFSQQLKIKKMRDTIGNSVARKKSRTDDSKRNLFSTIKNLGEVFCYPQNTEKAKSCLDAVQDDMDNIDLQLTEARIKVTLVRGKQCKSDGVSIEASLNAPKEILENIEKLISKILKSIKKAKNNLKTNVQETLTNLETLDLYGLQNLFSQIDTLLEFYNERIEKSAK